LEGLKKKNRPGCDGGYLGDPYADPKLKSYNRRRDSYGYTIFEKKRRQLF